MYACMHADLLLLLMIFISSSLLSLSPRTGRAPRTLLEQSIVTCGELVVGAGVVGAVVVGTGVVVVVAAAVVAGVAAVVVATSSRARGEQDM